MPLALLIYATLCVSSLGPLMSLSLSPFLPLALSLSKCAPKMDNIEQVRAVIKEMKDEINEVKDQIRTVRDDIKKMMETSSGMWHALM